MQSDHHVVVIGGGVAGADIATHVTGRMLASGKLRVTLIDREPAHVWKPMLHTIAAGTQDVYQQQTSYIAHAAECGFVFQPGEVTAIDRAARRISLAALRDGRERELVAARDMTYDTLVLAVGSSANDFNTPGVAQHCWTIDSRGEAMAFNEEVRGHIVQSIGRNTPLTIAIVGGGATGVELAAELIQLAEISESYGADGIAGRVKVVLIESGNRLLAAFSEEVAAAARERLEQLGVIVRTGVRVTAATEAGFGAGDLGTIEADLKVWAAGVKAPAVLSTLDDLERTRAGQIVVDANLRTTRDPTIFALGDCASLVPKGQDRPLPPTAQVAAQQARYFAAHVEDLIAGRDVPPFAFRDGGSLVSLGEYGAFGSLGKFGLLGGGFIRGRLAQLGHVLLYRAHQARLHGFWRGSLLWLTDTLSARVRPRIRLD